MTADPTKMIAQYVWKTRQMMLCAAIIAAQAMKAPNGFWLDECDFSTVVKDDRNCIGNTVKSLINLGLIRKTNEWRASTAEGRKGSTTFQYAVCAYSQMSALLHRLQPELARELNPQREMQLV